MRRVRAIVEIRGPRICADANPLNTSITDGAFMASAISRIQAVIVVVIIVVAAVAGVAYFVTLKTTTSTSLTKVTLTLPWLTAGYDSIFYAAVQEGFYSQHGLEVNITQGTGSGTALKAVAAGSFTFAEADIPTGLVAMSQGVPLVSVGVINPLSGLSVIAIATRNNLTSPQSIEGLTWGYHPGGANSVAFSAFLLANNIPSSTIKSNTSIGYPEEQYLMSGSVNFITEFINYEAVNVIDAGFKVSLLPFFQYGLTMYGMGLFTSATTAKNNPQLVSEFVAATIQGMIWVMENPTQAVSIVHTAVSDTNTTLLRDQLASSFAYKLFTSGNVTTNGLMYQSSSEWNYMANLLHPLLGTSNQNITSMYTNQFLPAASDRALPSSMGQITGANVPGIGTDMTVTASGPA
jgi:NitT/TauT family transport system substrate-binding protein